MWWPVVFWLLLIPLAIAEVIIFVKTRKFSWLVYTLAIFSYVITVSYTLDVFEASRNVIIATLVISAIVMALIGRQLGRKVKRQKSYSTRSKWVVGIFATVIVVVFAVSVIFGTATETLTPVDSIEKKDIVREPEKLDRGIETGIHILTRTLHNNFFLPVPVVRKEFSACVVTDEGSRNVYANTRFDANKEVPAYGSLDVKITVQSYFGDASASELLVYDGEGNYVECNLMEEEPLYRIPIV